MKSHTVKLKHGRVLTEKKFVHTIAANKIITEKKLYVEINNVSIEMQIDTGSDITIINKATWKTNEKPILKITSKIARGVLVEKLFLLA